MRLLQCIINYIEGNLHWGANHLPGYTVGETPDAGWKHYHHWEIYIEEPITSPEILLEKPQTQDESITTIGEIYIEEPITSPEILSEKPQTQDESITTIQETPNSQFRLVLSVTPCMPRISSLEWAIPFNIKGYPPMDDSAICLPWDKNFALTPLRQTVVNRELRKIYWNLQENTEIS